MVAYNPLSLIRLTQIDVLLHSIHCTTSTIHSHNSCQSDTIYRPIHHSSMIYLQFHTTSIKSRHSSHNFLSFHTSPHLTLIVFTRILKIAACKINTISSPDRGLLLSLIPILRLFVSRLLSQLDQTSTIFYEFSQKICI